MQPNIFLEGNFAPIQNEFTLTHSADFEIKGKVPKDMHGTYYRNGPNPAHPAATKHHWFFGDGMVHAFEFNRGHVQYRNRFVVTPTYKMERAAKKNLFFNGGLSPLTNLQLLGSGIFSLLNSLVANGNADVYTRLIAKANTSLLLFRDKLYALVESSPPLKIETQTLATSTFEEFGVNFIAPFTAHPKIDPRTGYLYAIGYRVFGKERLLFYAINPSGKMVARTAIDIPFNAMIHDFVITRNYAIIPIFPAEVSLGALRRGRIADWKPDKGTHFFVIAKNGDKGTLRSFSLPACYVYHYTNAHEEGKTIVVDAIRYNKVSLMSDDPTHRAEISGGENPGRLTRFVLDLTSGKIEESILDENFAVEFPQIDPRRVGEKNAYHFSAAVRESGRAEFFDTQLRSEIVKGKVRHEVYRFPAGHFCGEPMFVPTGKAQECKGYILNIVYDSHAERSYLAVSDAAKMERKPLCEIYVPHRIPYGFHGVWHGQRSQRG